jgi:protein ImuB
VFAEPILHAEGVAQWGARLVTELCAQLEAEGLGARRLVLTGFRTDGRTSWFSAALGLASRDPDHLIRLLRERGWARLDVGFGLDALRLSAPVTERLAASQRDLAPHASFALPGLVPGIHSATSKPPNGPQASRHGPPEQVRGRRKGELEVANPETDRAMAALVDRLTARLGEAAVLRPVWRESWTPERAERLAPYASAPPTASSPKPAAQPRPILLFSPPEPIEAVAELPDGAPARFTWRRASRRVARASGPERLAPEWWRGPLSPRDRPAAVRDYYSLEDEEGGRYWVFREGLYGAPGPDRETPTPSWWLQGLFP